MAASTQPAFRIRTNSVFLRDEVILTALQRAKLVEFVANWNPSYVDILPPTRIVHRQLAERKLGLNMCAFITGTNVDYMRVFAAPKHHQRVECKELQKRRPFVSKYPWWARYNVYTNIQKCDLLQIKSFKNAPSMSSDYENLQCFICSRRDDHPGLERRLFALRCGHFACRGCWLKHAKWALERALNPIPCPSGGCGEKLTIQRASTLLSDSALDVMIAVEWRNKKMQKDNVQCAGCNQWLERTNFYQNPTSARCSCGCYTCVRCGKLLHIPLTCQDGSMWSEIRGRDNDEEAAELAELKCSMSRDDFDESLGPSKALNTDQFKNNLRHMKKYDKYHGKILEKDLPIVARMLEMRFAQKLGKRAEMQINHHDEYIFADQRWEYLELYFTRALDTLGSTKEKARQLHQAMESVHSMFKTVSP